MKVTDAERKTDANERPISLGALVHGVVNSTASISFSASALRTGGKLSGSDIEALVRIEQAAAQVAESVKRFAAAESAPGPRAPEQGATVELLGGLVPGRRTAAARPRAGQLLSRVR
jgi:hypothetical protein